MYKWKKSIAIDVTSKENSKNLKCYTFSIKY